jgi:plastocyanin
VKRVRRALVMVVSATVLALTVTTSSGDARAAVPAQPSGKAKITIGDNFYRPDEIEITAGTKVVWTNKGKILHNVRPSQGKAFGTKAVSSGKSYSYRFKKPGEYAYYCSFHGSPTSGQRGTIIVTEAPATTSTTRAG